MVALPMILVNFSPQVKHNSRRGLALLLVREARLLPVEVPKQRTEDARRVPPALNNQN